MPTIYATWTTKDGDVLRLADMETVHLQRCIYMIMRAYRYKMHIDGLRALSYACADDTPDGASMAAEQEATYLLESCDDPVACYEMAYHDNEKFRHLVGELSNRGIIIERTLWRLPQDISPRSNRR
jgi:hypothetical protein